MFNSMEEHYMDSFNSNNEFENAYQLSKLEANLNEHEEEIKKHLKNGKYLIIEEQDCYCSFTDAIIGVKRYITGIYDSRKEAENELNDFCYIIPAEINIPINRPINNDDIPF